MTTAATAQRDWIADLRGPHGLREQAVADLHALLLRAASFELARRRGQLAHLTSADVGDLATEAADDALLAVLSKLGDFAGRSRFTTWAYKFALLEAGVKARRRAWHGREIVVDHELWPEPRDSGMTAQERAEHRELMDALRDAIAEELTDHQREVFIAAALNGVPIDVLAERRGTTRGALYKTLHDARRRLRAALAAAGHIEEGAP